MRWWYSASQAPSSPRPAATTSNTSPAAPAGTSCSSRATRTTAFDADFAVVRLDLAGQQFQQGGLAGAIAADQGDALAGLDGQVDIFQQQRAADAVVDVLQGNQGHARHSTRHRSRRA